MINDIIVVTLGFFFCVAVTIVTYSLDFYEILFRK